MTQEEKAKRYDEIIEKAKSKIKNDKDHVLYEDDIIEIIPELKGSTESENERIKRVIMNVITKVTYSELDGLIPDTIRIWLEKQGEQKPAEWSEEDYTMRQRILQDLLNIKTEYPKLNIDDEIEWFKSRYPQLQWKPSEEQMDALSFCLKYVDNDGVFGRQLVKLYQNLKNLREE